MTYVRASVYKGPSMFKYTNARAEWAERQAGSQATQN